MSAVVGLTTLVKRYSERHGVSQSVAKDAICNTLGILNDAIVEDGGFTVKNSFTLKTKTRAERTGRNPKTNEVVKIPASVGLKLTISKELKERLNP